MQFWSVFQSTCLWVCLGIFITAMIQREMYCKIVFQPKTRWSCLVLVRPCRWTCWMSYVPCICILNTKGNCGELNDSSVFMLFCFFKAAITLTIVMAFPLVVFPCRYTLDVMLKHLFESNSNNHNSGGETGEIVFRSSNAEELDSGIIGYNTNNSNINEANDVDVHPTTSKCRHLTLTTLICASALTIALFVSKIQIVFQLMGGTWNLLRLACAKMP